MRAIELSSVSSILSVHEIGSRVTTTVAFLNLICHSTFKIQKSLLERLFDSCLGRCAPLGQRGDELGLGFWN